MLPFAAAGTAGAGYIFEATGSYDIRLCHRNRCWVAGMIAAFFMSRRYPR